ncbi:MAG: hypothetical protein GF308_08170 [Candidatus Heimdallarchaeota archaeon]|nr:hypothetical protein [Candidatus Heimdallarchaeota archaeon]
MIESEEEAMNKETRRSSEEIIPILAKILTTEEQSLGKIAEQTKEFGELKYETIERHIKLIQQVQELFCVQGKKMCYQEQEIGGRVYRSAWLEEQ